MHKHYKTPFPAANVNRLNETVGTDTSFSNVPAHDDVIQGHGGATIVQFYSGVKSLLSKAFPMKSSPEMPGTLEDFIQTCGAANAMFSDNAPEQCTKQVNEILRLYSINNMQCEPYHQHQNPAERRMQEVKKTTNAIMDCTSATAR
jgi:hypothetical protein